MEFLDDPQFVALMLIAASLRLYMEIIGVRLEELPLSKKLLAQNAGAFHRLGLYCSIACIILFSPQILLS